MLWKKIFFEARTLGNNDMFFVLAFLLCQRLIFIHRSVKRECRAMNIIAFIVHISIYIVNSAECARL